MGTVLQAYLYRSEADLADLLPLEPNLRFVKGAYLEPPSLAYPAKADVDAAYLRLVEAALRGGGLHGGRNPGRDDHRPGDRVRRE